VPDDHSRPCHSLRCAPRGSRSTQCTSCEMSMVVRSAESYRATSGEPVSGRPSRTSVPNIAKSASPAGPVPFQNPASLPYGRPRSKCTRCPQGECRARRVRTNDLGEHRVLDPAHRAGTVDKIASNTFHAPEHASTSRSSRHCSQPVSIVPAITFPANSCWRSSYWRSMSGAGRGVSDADSSQRSRLIVGRPSSCDTELGSGASGHGSRYG